MKRDWTEARHLLFEEGFVIRRFGSREEADEWRGEMRRAAREVGARVRTSAQEPRDYDRGYTRAGEWMAWAALFDVGAGEVNWQ